MAICQTQGEHVAFKTFKSRLEMEIVALKRDAGSILLSSRAFCSFPGKTY